jgi:hypothetical protein
MGKGRSCDHGIRQPKFLEAVAAVYARAVEYFKLMGCHRWSPEQWNSFGGPNRAPGWDERLRATLGEPKDFTSKPVHWGPVMSTLRARLTTRTIS